VILPLVAEIVRLNVPAPVPGLLWPPPLLPPPHDVQSSAAITASANGTHVLRPSRACAKVRIASIAAMIVHSSGARKGRLGPKGGARRDIGVADAAVLATVTVTVVALEPFRATEAGDGVQVDSVRLPGSVHVTWTVLLKPFCGVSVSV
jgi:hypothetical protein